MQITKNIEVADAVPDSGGILFLGAGIYLGVLARRIGINQGVVPTLVELSYDDGSGSGSAGGTVYGVDLDSARSWRMSSADTDQVKPDNQPLTTASAVIPDEAVTGTKTIDVTSIFTEIFARSGWKSGYNAALVIVSSGSGARFLTRGSFSLEFTLASIPAATSYRVESHLAGQKCLLADSSVLPFDTLRGMKDLESQDILVSTDGDADGVEISFNTVEGGMFSPNPLVLVGSEPGLVRYTPTSDDFMHYISATNNGGLANPSSVRYTVRRSRLFPDNAVWYKDISNTSLDSTGLHDRFADYAGASMRIFAGTKYAGHVIEQQIHYRDGTETRKTFSFTLYPDEADPVDLDGKLPFGDEFIVENYPPPAGDHHGILFDVSTDTLHEMYGLILGETEASGFHCKWDVNSLNIRTPLGYSSAAADGRPLAPFILTYDEILYALEHDGIVPHPLRFTIPFTTLNTYIWDASHSTSNGGPGSPTYGTRMRLKADYDISGFSEINQVILRTLKKYGCVLGDGGLAWFFSTENDYRWNQEELLQFNGVFPYNDFETVDQLQYMSSNTSYAAAAIEPVVSRKFGRRLYG